jgi:rhodanese-related sulfurtransferase
VRAIEPNAVPAKTETKRVLGEALAVGLVGGLFALLANAVSPRAFNMRYDYFAGDSARTTYAPFTNAPGSLNATNLSAFERLAAEFQAKGLQLADSNQVIRLFRDPRKEQNLVLFIDARGEDEFHHGHIPGAYLFDHFHMENYLPTVAPICETAQQIVVYCAGGSCELSEHTAIDLRDIVHIPKEKLFVYAGGINEWNTNQMPIEVGDRLSGKLQ